MAGATGSRLVEDVERLERLELILLVHVVLRHYLLELGARHVHRAPPAMPRNSALHPLWNVEQLNYVPTVTPNNSTQPLRNTKGCCYPPYKGNHHFNYSAA